MNEEQAVLNFFAAPENLPLALIVGEQIDSLRQQLNRQFWSEVTTYIQRATPSWLVSVTEDRNNEDCLVGLHLRPSVEQQLFLQPMLEQQLNQGELQIYFGLIWSSTPTVDKLNLPEVVALRAALERDGYRDNEGFLAWRWTSLYPRRKDFLLRFNSQRESLLSSAAKTLKDLLARHNDLLLAANYALAKAPTSSAISLTQLRANLPT
jgi:hypothetical protein